MWFRSLGNNNLNNKQELKKNLIIKKTKICNFEEILRQLLFLQSEVRLKSSIRLCDHMSLSKHNMLEALTTE